MKKFLTLLILPLISAFFSSALDAQEIKTLKCTFDKPAGISSEWNIKEEFISKPSKFILENQYVSVVFDSIDLKNQKARIIGNNGAEDVYVLHTGKILSFLEITPTGNQILTSVFVGSQLSNRSFPVVMSRHMSLPVFDESNTILRPLISQYYGICIDQSF